MRKTLASIGVVALAAVPGAAQAAEDAGYKIGTDNCYVYVEDPVTINLSYPPQIYVHPRPVSIYCPHE